MALARPGAVRAGVRRPAPVRPERQRHRIRPAAEGQGAAMTDLPASLRDWLAAGRPSLNARFRQAQRRFPALDSDTVLSLCRELLPPLADTPALLDAAYELVLL